MLELVHNLVLGVFALYGAVLLGRWVISRRWHWAAKFVVLVFVASLVVSGMSLVLGSPPDDLRIFTELLASAGAIVACTSLLASRTARRSPWVQYGVPVALLLFLAWTWREQIADVRHGTLPVMIAPTAVTVAPVPPAPSRTAPSRADLCAQGRLGSDLCDDL